MPLGPIPAPGGPSASGIAAALDYYGDLLGVDVSTLTGPVATAPVSGTLGFDFVARMLIESRDPVDLVDSMRYSLDNPWTGKYLRVGKSEADAAEAHSFGAFQGPALGNFTGDGLDLRVTFRAVDNAASAVSEFTELVGQPMGTLGDPGWGAWDRYEAAVWWLKGLPYAYDEHTETGGTAELAYVSGPMIPGLWVTLRFLTEFDVGGETVMSIMRLTDSGWDTETTGSLRWRTFARRTKDGTSDLIDDPDEDTPWWIGLGRGTVDIGKVEIRDGVDGTVVSRMDADDASSTTVVPDDVFVGGEWEATAGGTGIVVTP